MEVLCHGVSYHMQHCMLRLKMSFFLSQPFLFPLTFSAYSLEMGNDDITRLLSYHAEIIIKCLIYITRGVRFLEKADNADSCMLLKAIQ